MSVNQITQMTYGMDLVLDIITDFQYGNKDVVENAISESLDKLSILFDNENFAPMDKAIKEVAGLLSIRLRDEYRQIRLEIYNSISNIISAEFSKVNCSIETLVYQLKVLRELSKQYEMSLAKRESVIELLKSEIDQTKLKAESDVFKERKERQNFCSQLAYAHARRALVFRVWKAWKRGVEASWKQRTHRRFVKESQQICVQLSEDYEIKIAELKDKLQESEKRCAEAELSQALVQESMKSALMRGVCALNMETMSILQPKNELKSSEKPLNISIPDAFGGTVVGSHVKGNINTLYYLPDKPLISKSPDYSRDNFSASVPVRRITAEYNEDSDDSALTALFRTQTVEFGKPVGPSHFSSANLSKIRVHRHDSINQALTIPRGNQNNPRSSVNRRTIRNKAME